MFPVLTKLTVYLFAMYFLFEFYQLYVDSLNMFYTVQSYLTVLSCQNVFFVENGKLWLDVFIKLVYSIIVK